MLRVVGDGHRRQADRTVVAARWRARRCPALASARWPLPRSTAPRCSSDSATRQFDVLVVGGGITGAGVALDAATRGLRTALVERDDFASGTSSKSSKLIHGGLRYLQNGDVRLVYEALHERQRLLKNAPHLVRVLPFMIPVLTKDGVISRKIARALGSAMWMYDLTGGWRIGKRHRRLRGDAAFAHLPTMPRERLASAYLYYDAATDDARLTLGRRPHRSAARGSRRQPLPRHVVHPRRRRADRRRRGRHGRGGGHGPCPRRRERHGCVDRRGPRPRREGRPRLDPAGEGHPSHGAVGQGPQRHRGRHPGAARQAQPVRGAVGAQGRRHVRAHLHRHHRHRLRRSARRSAVHRRRTSPTSSARSTTRSRPASRPTT